MKTNFNEKDIMMQRITKLLGLGLVALALWGCGGQSQSETATQNEATVQEAQAEETKTEVANTTTSPTAKRPFITKWKGEAGKALQIPIYGTYTLTWYNEATPNERHTEEEVSVDSYVGKFGDEDINFYTFTPPTDGVYVVEAGPEGVESIKMVFEEELNIAPTLLSVVQFGDVVWKKLYDAFHSCTNMRFEEGIDTPNLSQCTNLNDMFKHCERFNSPLEHWNVSKVKTMVGMFDGCKAFNQPLEKWNVSNVTDMSWMFCGCERFNQPLEKWDVSKVTGMSDMFTDCTAFNQPLAQWDVANVKDMSRMFYGCSSFNQSLEAWNINPLAHSEGMVGMFNDSPAAELPFAAKWRAAGYDIDMYEEMQ